MPKRTRDYEADLLQRLADQDYAVDYLNAVLADSAEDDGGEFLAALRLVAKAQGIAMSQLAEETELGRQALYRSLSKEGNPVHATLVAVLRQLGLRLAVDKAA